MDMQIVENGDGGDVELQQPLVFDEYGSPSTSNADLKTDSGIGTAIYLSLFEGSAWYNVLQGPDRPFSPDEFEDLLRKPITGSLLSELEQAAISQLSWMEDESVVTDLVVEATNPTLGKVVLDIYVTEPNSKRNKYSANWDYEKQVLERVTQEEIR